MVWFCGVVFLVISLLYRHMIVHVYVLSFPPSSISCVALSDGCSNAVPLPLNLHLVSHFQDPLISVSM